MAVAIIEKPILFSGDMVRAILDGRKGNTRRIVTRNNSTVLGDTRCENWDELLWNGEEYADDSLATLGMPRNQYLHVPAMCEGDEVRYRVGSRVSPGDTLWVREAWGLHDTQLSDGPDDAHVYYRATDGDRHDLRYQKWRPSIHMPRWACRLRLNVTGVRVERLQDITEEDAIAEGAGAAERVCDFCGWIGTWDELEEVGETEDSHPCPRCKEDTDGWYLDEQYRKGFQYLWQSINGPESWAANPWVWVYEFERKDDN